MGHPQIAVFARLADGNAKPTRRIEGQKTLLSRAQHGIAYDEIHDEFILPQSMAQAVLTFRGGANGEEAPIRVIQGPLTQLTYVDRVAVDPVHNEIFVPLEDKGAVLVFPREANGNVAPIRVLQGPETQLGASSVVVDPVRDLLIVAGRGPLSEGRRGIYLRIFNRTDQGNVKPRAVIGGPKSGLHGLAGPLAFYPPKGLIIVPVAGPDISNFTSDDFVGIWSVQDNGDVPPRWTIGGPQGVLKHLHGVALVPKYKELIATDKRINAVLTFSFPEIF